MTVRTFDSLTYAATGGGDIRPSIPNIVWGFLAQFGQRVVPQEEGRDLGKVCDQALRCTGTFVPCKYHAPTLREHRLHARVVGRQPPNTLARGQ